MQPSNNGAKAHGVCRNLGCDILRRMFPWRRFKKRRRNIRISKTLVEKIGNYLNESSVNDVTNRIVTRKSRDASWIGLTLVK